MGIEEMFRLDGKNAIVTGCSSGLGVAISSSLAEAGANLVICARRGDKLRANAERIAKKTGRRVLPVVADISKEDDIKRLVAEADREFGKLDVLVNNAGTSLVKPAEELSSEEWLSTNRVNLDGTFYCSRDVAKLMIKRKTGGSIINIASSYGFSADILFPLVAYHASKAAVINLTRALAVEWAKYGIRVNAIAPGYFRTELTQQTLADKKKLAYILQHTPLGRVGVPQELSGALLLLASQAGDYITGSILTVDGGWNAI